MRQEEKKKQITTKEAAELLGVAQNTVLSYTRQGILTAVNEKSWKIDNTKYFYKDDVEEVKDRLKKPGLSTSEVAAQLGVSSVTVFNYIKDGKLSADKEIYRGRELYFIKQMELDRFQKNYKNTRNRNNKGFYSKSSKQGWFQLFIHEGSQEQGRLMVGEDRDYFLLTTSGNKITYAKIDEYGFKPCYLIERGSIISKRNFAKFEFPYEYNVKSNIYCFLDKCYEYITPTNMRMNINKQMIVLEIKPFCFPYDALDEDMTQTIKEYLVEGSIISTVKGIYIDSEYDMLSLEIPTQVKNSLKLIAAKRGLTLEDLVSDILVEFVNEGMFFDNK
ncbi:helix-turn-helix domain-containing protein [Niallia circulans]|uniref:helix-turn-helix domain-containing protein n=1 Tax=Niallia circulans TaxID=1397 RepID=UPI0015602AB7|nr:helix-turn-helix domain-containing protein [Niallia circulans]NRG31603.1 helix-turn-helix domain-containing protein [Niallia circulans]